MSTINKLFPFLATALVSASATACFMNPNLLTINPVASASEAVYTSVAKSVEFIASPDASVKVVDPERERISQPSVDKDAAKVVDNPDVNTWTDEDWKDYRRQLRYLTEWKVDQADQWGAVSEGLTLAQYRSLHGLYKEIADLEAATYVDPTMSFIDRASMNKPSDEWIASQKLVILQHEAALKAEGIDTRTSGGVRK